MILIKWNIFIHSLCLNCRHFVQKQNVLLRLNQSWTTMQHKLLIKNCAWLPNSQSSGDCASIQTDTKSGRKRHCLASAFPFGGGLGGVPSNGAGWKCRETRLPFLLLRSRNAGPLWCRWRPGGRRRPDTGTTCGSATGHRTVPLKSRGFLRY